MSTLPRSVLEDLLYKPEEGSWGQLSHWMRDTKEFDSALFPTGNPDAISPFVLAAYSGKYDTVCRLLEGATDPHSVNATSRIIARIRGSGRLECLTSVTALLASSISGQVDVAQHLLEHGADVDAEDCCGWTALCRAAARGDTAITSLLLDYSSDVDHITPNGFAPAHLAALNCDIDTLQLLGKRGAVLSRDGAANSAAPPCPLYVAAACGHKDIVEKLTSDDPTCPIICKINAELLLGAATYLQGRSLVPRHSNSGCPTLARWRDALSLLGYHGLALNVAPPSTYYGSEIADVQEFDETYRRGWFPHVLHQSLMIRERCLGPEYTVIPEMLDWLPSFAKQTRVLRNKAGSPWEAVAPGIIHTMDIHIRLCQTYFERAQHCQLLECLDTATSYILFPVFDSGYYDMQLWIACAEYAISLLQLCFLMATSDGYPCGNPPKLVPIIIDFLIRIALMDDIATNYVSEQNASGSPTVECSMELVNACCHFVQTCAPYPEQAGEILNATISQSARENGEECGVVLQLLLHWFAHCGAADAVNALDHNGERPLCLAAKLHYSDACHVLLKYGAHPDATNAKGKTAADFLSPLEAQKLGFGQVRQLKCLASRKILAAKVSYDRLDTQLVEFIHMHSASA